MQVHLVVTNKALNESQSYDFVVEEKITLGRYLGSPVVLQGDRLSRNHLSLSVVDGMLTIEDLSSNGTWLNGMQLKEKTSVSINQGDIIEIPGYQMEVNIQNRNAPGKMQVNNPSTMSVDAPVPKWKIPFNAVSDILEPRETVLLLLALASFGIIVFFLDR